MKTAKHRKGFTLIEVILAAVILCGAVLALGAISTRSLSQTKLNRQYEAATRLADKQLSMIDYMGIRSFIDSGVTQGEIEEPGQEYEWEVVTEPMNIDELYQVKITVRWIERRRPYSVTLATRLSGAGSVGEIVKY